MHDMSNLDSHIVHLIRSGGAAREKAMKEIIRWEKVRNIINKNVLSNSGSLSDAQEVFYEAIVVLDNKIRNGSFEATGSVKGYITSCAKYIWMNRLKKQGSMQYYEDIALIADAQFRPSYVTEQKHSWSDIQKYWNRLSERCQNILKMWTLGYSMEEIFEESDVSSPAMAKKQKYTCLKKLKSLVFAE